MLLLLTMLLSTAPAAPSSEQCDAKPFTLNKPAAKPAAEAPRKTETATKTAEAKPTPKQKPKAKPLADCDQPKKKG